MRGRCPECGATLDLPNGRPVHIRWVDATARGGVLTVSSAGEELHRCSVTENYAKDRRFVTR